LSPTVAATVAGVSHTAGLKWARAAGYLNIKDHRGIRYPQPVREAFWEAMRSGSSVIEAAVIAGVSQPAACAVRASGPGCRRPPIEADAPNVVWAIDFQFDSTTDGKVVKIASMID
jgi:hypothetical protein